MDIYTYDEELAQMYYDDECFYRAWLRAVFQDAEEKGLSVKELVGKLQKGGFPEDFIELAVAKDCDRDMFLRGEAFVQAILGEDHLNYRLMIASQKRAAMSSTE